MSEAINIKHLAKLSRLNIESDQEARFATQMENIVKMVEHLPSIESNESLVDPNNAMKCREDVVKNDFKRDDILKNAPQVKAGCIVVPKVIE